MKRTTLTGILGTVFLVDNLFVSGLSYTYLNSPAKNDAEDALCIQQFQPEDSET